MTRSQACRDQLQWIELNCPLDRTSIIPIKKANEFIERHVEISTLSTDAIQPLTKIKDERVQENVVATLKTRIDAGDKPTRKDVVRCIQKEQYRSQPAPAPLPKNKFNVILADPPWRYEHSKTYSREIENQYPTMGLEAIKALTIPADDNAMLFLWSTSPKLAEALTVMSAWSFTYRTSMVWDKDQMGMGYYARIQHEFLLIGMKGAFRAPDPENRPVSVIRCKSGEHSAKPAIVYEIIERMYPDGTYLEMFARSKRSGWVSWGNEAVLE